MGNRELTSRRGARVRAGALLLDGHPVARAAVRELAIGLAAVLAYFFVRGLTQADFDQAAANAHHVLRFEEWLGIHFEEDVQDLFIGSRVLTTGANWVYIWGHWPVITAVAVWLILKHPEQYRVTRNAFLISGGIGLIIFAAFPVAPPRLLDIGLVDTVTERSHAYRVLQPRVFTNQYAAMPSLHLGWDLLIGIALVRGSHHWLVRGIGVVLPMLMAVAIVATANHFIVDGVAGIALGLVGLACATWIEHRRRRREPPPDTPHDHPVPP